MKCFLALFFVFFFCNLNFGQIAVIKDQDGYTNVRKQPNIDSEIIYKLNSSEVFLYEENSSESAWITVYISKKKYQLASSDEANFKGYIHKSRLCPIDDLTKYVGTEFLFQYELNKFNLDNKILDFDGKWLTRINGRRFYGTDGDLPKTEVVGIKAAVKWTSIEIPKMLYEDIFECENSFEIHKNNDDYIVHHWNGDGAGAYLLVWVLGNEKLKQRLIFIP